MHERPEPPSARATSPLTQGLLALDRVAGRGLRRHGGNAPHEEGRAGSALEAVLALSLPRVVFANGFSRSSGIVLLKELLLPEAGGMLPVEGERARVPPDNALGAGPRGVEAGGYRVLGAPSRLLRPFKNAVGAEVRTPRRRLGMPPLGVRGVDDRMKRTEPAVDLLVSHGRDHQEVPRPRRRDIYQANSLFSVPSQLLIPMLKEFRRDALAERLDPQSLTGI